MTSRVSHTSVDCANADEHSEFWKRVLGAADVPGTGRVTLAHPEGNEFCVVRSDVEQREAGV